MIADIEKESCLIVGLGNPGKAYEETRHNIGVEVVKAFAKKHEMPFKKHEKLKGHIAQKNIGGRKVFLLMPSTYMNESGKAVVLSKNYFKLKTDNILAVVDDAEIPLGELRLKKDSGTGGHNGLLSIEEALHSKAYARLRIGIGQELDRDLRGYVLGKFTEKEKIVLCSTIERAVLGIELWLFEGLHTAMNQVNIRLSRKKNFETIEGNNT